ncbi:MAG: transcriptional regulator [Thermoplasmata archaeon]|nr:MAG: transcriptional regulator [Thermoplasmata archaeon]
MNILDPNHILSQHTRLAIMITLVSQGKIVFSELQKILEVTPGNLDSHLRKLEESGYVKITKAFLSKGPRTVITITDDGYHSTMLYISKLKQALESFIERRGRQ